MFSNKNCPKTIFIPIPFLPNNDYCQKNYSEECRKNYLILNNVNGDKNIFREQFNMQDIVNLINDKIENATMQVGVSYEEAVQIVNQHAHCAMYFILEVQVRRSEVSQQRKSEKDMFSSQINSKEKPYFYLVQKKTKTENELLAMQLMTNYMNSNRYVAQWQEEVDKYFARYQVNQNGSSEDFEERSQPSCADTIANYWPFGLGRHTFSYLGNNNQAEEIHSQRASGK